jgi:hypothetical protein
MEASVADKLPLARAYSPGELSRVLEKQVEARLGVYSITGLELEGVLAEIGDTLGSTGSTWRTRQEARASS